ncbi:hypothetical protein [uncultured Cedecea sp.]|uniref:hypothetical protein n=1 Tax=uncultured Cedecea sp. TaxID=988762 RepID=UPI00261F7A29|nr:hypothetical protein [uncultured Cedecea sp.]
MTKKIIYLEMLRLTLLHMRYLTSLGVVLRIRDRSAKYETQLAHSFYYLLLNEDFESEDIHFLNSHCRDYYENCNQNISILYNSQVDNIAKLFSIVPEHLKSELKWKGPE